MSIRKVLPLHHVADVVGYFKPIQELQSKVNDASPAILVMTDLRRQLAVTIEQGVSIDWALERMKTCGVRLLFVVDADENLQGLITSTDILGEKPLQYRQDYRVKREEILVGDIMTPRASLEVMIMDDVMKASVGDIVSTLQAVGRHHALILDRDVRSGKDAIRGIFSVSQISKQLDRLIDTTEVASTFAEVEMVLNN